MGDGAYGGPKQFGKDGYDRSQPSVSHAAQRALERFGVQLSSMDMLNLAHAIAAGQGLLVERQSDGSERRRFAVKGVPMIVVWQPARQLVITILPLRRFLAERLRRPGHGGKWRGSEGYRERGGPDASEWE